jgi:hypothetical protein
MAQRITPRATKTTSSSRRLPQKSPDSSRYGGGISTAPAHARIDAGIARSFQIVSVFRNLSVFETVRVAVQARSPFRASLWRDAYDLPGVNDKTWALLASVGLTERAGATGTNLAHGEQRLLEIAVALATDPMPEARQNNSKLAEMLASASIFRALVGMAVNVAGLFMALLSFVESAPRAYRLKASNAAPPISTSAGTSASPINNRYSILTRSASCCFWSFVFKNDEPERSNPRGFRLAARALSRRHGLVVARAGRVADIERGAVRMAVVEDAPQAARSAPLAAAKSAYCDGLRPSIGT